MRVVFLLFLLVTMIVPDTLAAKRHTAVLRLCFKQNGQPFTVATQDEKVARKKKFPEFKGGIAYMMKMRVSVDGAPNHYFKPYNESCITIYRIPAGRHTVSVSFRAATYTTLRVIDSYSKKFKEDLLYTGTVHVTADNVAHVTIKQHSNRMLLYEALNNAPVENCETECDVPAGIPIYFRERNSDQKIPCPVDYTLIVANKKEKDLPCYSDKRIRRELAQFVKQERIMCKADVEKALFVLMGEGCLVSPESNRDGLHYEQPKIVLIPLEERQYHYELFVDDKLTPYKFSEEKQGDKIVPKADQHISLREIKNK